MLPVHWPDEELWAERTARTPSLALDDEKSGLTLGDGEGNEWLPRTLTDPVDR